MILPVIFLFAILSAAASGATHQIVGTEYFHTFSASHPVLIRIRSGDTLVTKTVDSAGFDFDGVRRTRTHGNPLTGAIYVEGAEPGDSLAVRLDKVRLNRASGYTAYQAGIPDLPADLGVAKPGDGRVYAGYDSLLPWSIDRKANTATSGRWTFPTQPMLGCIGVAPKGDYSPRSGPAGYWGGNIDYNLVREGTTVLLPVFHRGGLLFFGDGHALQGDGEAIGSGIETSLDVQVTVTIRKSAPLDTVRLETAEWIVSVGSGEKSTLNETLRIATLDMLRWLVKDYALTPAEAHLLIGMQARYDLITLGGSTGLRIPKTWLKRPAHTR